MKHVCNMVIGMFVLLALSAGAGVPELMNYQGYLTNSLGEPLNSTVSMTFTIYDDSTGGTALWSETHPTVAVADGKFNLMLGSTYGASFPFDVTISDGECFIEIVIGSDPPLEPRTRIASVPYAFHAATVVGFTPGPDNVSSGPYTFVAGDSNTVSGDYSSIAGGYGNVASGDYSSVGGGYGNYATGENEGTTLGAFDGSMKALLSPDGDLPGYAYVGGGRGNYAAGMYSFVGAGSGNYAWGLVSTISGGLDNKAWGQHSTIGGGDYNRTGVSPGTGGEMATIGGGFKNLGLNSGATIAGGIEDTVTNDMATIGGGHRNVAGGWASVVSGGEYNRARGDHAVVSGGGGFLVTDSNAAIGDYSTVPGGTQNVAVGDYSLVAGHRAKTTASGSGSFVWADNTNVDFVSNAPNQFLIRASGYVGINTNNPQTTLHLGGVSGVDGIIFPDGTKQTTATAGTGGTNNTLDEAYDQGGAGVGRTITADAGAVNIAGPNGLTVNGNVGIGNVAPGAALDISGNIKINDASASTGYVLTALDATGLAHWAPGAGGSDSDWDITTNAPDMFTIPTGNVGIGTSVPSGKFHIGGNNTHLSAHPVYTAPTATNGMLPLSDPEKQGIVLNAYTRDGLDSYRRYSDIVSLGYANGSYGGGVIRFLTNDHVTGSGIAVERMRIERDGLVGIGTTTPHSSLTVNGDITPDIDGGSNLGSSSYRWGVVYAVNGTIQTSDARWKTDINEMNYGLSELLQLRPVTYRWKDNPNRGRQLGLIAQEVQPIIGEVIDVGDDPDHTLGINYANLVPVLIKSIQELKAENDALKQKTDRLDELQTQLDQLQKLVETKLAKHEKETGSKKLAVKE